MNLKWVGGPLDGCEDKMERPSNLWVGPDPVAPYTKGIVYALKLSPEGGIYDFSQKLTDALNRRLERQRNN